MLLIDIAQFHGLTHLKGTGVGLLHAHDQTEECGLSCTIGADDTNDAIRRQHEVQVGEQLLLGIRLRHAMCLDYLITQTGTIGDEYLELLLFLFLLLVEHLIV